MPGMVTPATIGWNMVSSSCRPRKYHGAFDGFGVLLKSASCSNGARTIAEKMVSAAVTISRDANSTTRRCGHVCTLSCGLGARLLDRAGLDDREQPLGVTPGAGDGGRRERGGGRGGAGRACGGGDFRTGRAARGGTGYVEAERHSPVAAALEQVRGDPPAAGKLDVAHRLGCGRGSSRRRGGGLGDLGDFGGRPRPALRPRPLPPRARGGRAPCGALCCVAAGVRGSRSWQHSYNGPETPPSFRTRQKCTAMKITITNGNNSTWRTYHRRSVSLLISLDPKRTYFTDVPNTGV